MRASELTLGASKGGALVVASGCGWVFGVVSLAVVATAWDIAWRALGRPAGYHSSDLLNPFVLPWLIGSALVSAFGVGLVGWGRRGALLTGLLVLGVAMGGAAAHQPLVDGGPPSWARTLLAAGAVGMVGGVGVQAAFRRPAKDEPGP